MASDLVRLLRRVAGRQAAAGAPQMATVTAIRPDGVRLQFLGDDLSPSRSFKALAPESLRVGDSVICLPVGGTWVVLGPAVAQRRLVWEDEFLHDDLVSYQYSNVTRLDVDGIVGAYRALTLATTNSTAYLALPPLWLRRNPSVAEGALGPNALTACKAIIGLTYTFVVGQAAPHAMFWFDSADGGNWFASVGNGSSFSEQDTGVPASVSVWRHFRIEIDSATPRARFYIDGEEVASLATNFPALTWAMQWAHWVQTTADVAKKLDVDYLRVLASRGY